MPTVEPSAYVLYVLPLLWIATATAVALLLYRTSEALVEHKLKTADGGTRRVRLVGSVAIAVVVFVLLWKASPPLIPDPSDVRLTSIQEQQLNARRVALTQAWARLQTCMDLPGISRCPEQQSDVDAAVRQFNAEYAGAVTKVKAK